MSSRFLVPLNFLHLASDPATGSLGDAYYNTITNSIWTYDGSDWVEAVGGGGSPGVISVDGNTGIVSLALSYDAYGAASAALSSAQDYADGLATNYEPANAVSTHAALTTTHGVTGSLVGTSDTQTLTNKTLSSTYNTITVTSSNVSDFVEAAQDAIGNNVGTGLSYNDTTGAISVTANTYDAYGAASAAQTAAESYASGLSSNYEPANAVSTHAALTTTHGVTGSIVGTSDSQTLTNKTLSSTYNTITVTSSDVSDFVEAAQDAVGNSVGTGLSYNDSTGAISVTANTYDAYGAASTVAGDLSTHISDTTAHGTTGDVVGTSDTQTLTNKTLTSPKINENVAVTATATELNILDGITASTTELNYVDGVTSGIQTQLDDKAPLASPTFTGTVTANNLTTQKYQYLTPISSVDKPSWTEGNMFYDNEERTVIVQGNGTSFELSMGQREWVRCRNSSGSTIGKGVPVYVTGVHIPGDPVHGHHPTIAPADASDVAKKSVIGITGESIANGSHGYVVVRGYIEGLDTSALTGGSRAHLGFETPGTLVDVAPDYPNYPVDLGICLTSDATNGTFYVELGNHSVEGFRVSNNSYFDGNVTVGGNLTLLGSSSEITTTNLSVANNIVYLNSGNTIGSAGTSFSGTGVNDATFVGHYHGTTTKTFKVKITVNGPGSNPDSFRWSTDNFATDNGTDIQIVAGTNYALSDEISVTFVSDNGHVVNDVWSGTAAPINVDIALIGNRNTGTTGVGYTHTGLFFDVTDSKFKVFSEYDPEPEINIDTSDTSFALGTFVADTFEGSLTGNVTGNVTGNAGTVTDGVYTTGSYSNPSWVTSLAWSKISSTPTTLSGYGITDSLTAATAASTYAPISSPTFTGTVEIPTLHLTTAALAVSYGGTGATTAGGAINNLLPSQSSKSGKFLTTDGSDPSWADVPAGYDAPTLGSTTLTSGSTVTTVAGLTLTGATLALRDTSAAYDVTITPTSSTTLTAGRTLTLDVVNSARTVKLGGNLTLGGSFTTSGAYATTLTATGATSVTLPTSGTLAVVDEAWYFGMIL